MSLFLSENAGMVGLLFFFAVFVAIAVWVYRPTLKKRIEDYKNIPLSEDDA